MSIAYPRTTLSSAAQQSGPQFFYFATDVPGRNLFGSALGEFVGHADRDAPRGRHLE